MRHEAAAAELDLIVDHRPLEYILPVEPSYSLPLFIELPLSLPSSHLSSLSAGRLSIFPTTMKGSSSIVLRWVPFVVAQSFFFLCIFHFNQRSSNCILPDWNNNVNEYYDPDAPMLRKVATTGSTSSANKLTLAATTLPPNPQIYFIHVGKAGGMTIHDSMQLIRTIPVVRCSANQTTLALANNHSTNSSSLCSRSRKYTPIASQLEQRIVGYFHMMGILLSSNERNWLMTNTNVFLYTVRDPISRLVSTYNYHRSGLRDATKFQSHDKFYLECFPNGLDDMITILRNNTKPACTAMGMNALSGKSLQGGWHFKYNYTHYKNYTMDQSPAHAVAVVRTEHLWDDIVHLDKLLGGSGNFGNKAGTKHTHGSQNYTVPYNDELSVSNTVYLCCLSYKDLESYQAMILRALNLEIGQKQEVLNDLINRCQVGASSVSSGSDLVHEQFSWEAYRHSAMCQYSLGN